MIGWMIVPYWIDLNNYYYFYDNSISFKAKKILFSTRLQHYYVETAIAIIADGSATLNIDTQHLRDLSFRVGSIYQFIGELHIQQENGVRF